GVGDPDGAGRPRRPRGGGEHGAHGLQPRARRQCRLDDRSARVQRRPPAGPVARGLPPATAYLARGIGPGIRTLLRAGRSAGARRGAQPPGPRPARRGRTPDVDDRGAVPVRPVPAPGGHPRRPRGVRFARRDRPRSARRGPRSPRRAAGGRGHAVRRPGRRGPDRTDPAARPAGGGRHHVADHRRPRPDRRDGRGGPGAGVAGIPRPPLPARAGRRRGQRDPRDVGPGPCGGRDVLRGPGCGRGLHGLGDGPGAGSDAAPVATRLTAVSLRVLIVDDQAMVRQGFSALLDAQPDITVIGDAANGAEAVARVDALRPAVVFMAVRMPVMDGLEAARRTLGSGVDPAPRIIMLTTFDLDDYVYEALRIGCSGFLLKDAPAEELFRAVRLAVTGEALLAPSVTRRLIEETVSRSKRPRRDPGALATLTPRELETVEQVATGRSNAEIATALFISEETVKTHVRRVLQKLALRDRAQVVVYAYENGVV